MVEADGAQPRHCLVDGHAASPGNTVTFRVALPDDWNGKFLFLGVGRPGGTIANLEPGLLRGYATASTDTGHQASETELGLQSRQGDRLRLPRHSRRDRGGKGGDRRLLRRPAALRLLQRLLERRPSGPDGSAALPGRLRRRDRRPSRHRHTDAGGPRCRLSEDARVAGQLPDDRCHRAAVAASVAACDKSRWHRRRTRERSARVPFRPGDAGLHRGLGTRAPA